MNLNNMIQISSPTKISIITRLRGPNSKILKEKNDSTPSEINQFTLFTSNNNSPSDLLYISERPLDSEKIKEAINSKNINLNFLNFDKVYSSSFSLDLIYQQILQNPINDLFYKKNSCMLFFGPTMGGKSYLLRGSPFKNDNESGLLTRAIKEIFQRLEFNNNFSLKLSVYQIYLDKMYDLLSDEAKELNIETNYGEISKDVNINILGLTKKEIKNSNEYDLILREGINNRRNLSCKFGINDIKKKSHFIISIFLENKIENNNNIEFKPYSQFDFIELVSSNFALSDEDENNNNNGIEQNLFQNTKETFNSIADNIICLSQDLLPNNYTLLTLALKKTMKQGSNIIFVNCSIPWEFPLKDSYLALKFTNMIFSKIYKNVNNTNILNNSSNNFTYSLNFSNNINDNNIFLNQNQNKNSINDNLSNNIINSGYEKMNEYLNNLTIDKMDYLFPEKDVPKKFNRNEERDYKEEINEKNDLYNKYNANDNNNTPNFSKPKKTNFNKLNKIKSNRNNKNLDIDKNINKKINTRKKNNKTYSKNNNINYDNINNSPKERKLKKLNEELKELEAKSNELNQNSLEQDYLYSSNNIDKNILNTENNINNLINNEEKNKSFAILNSNTYSQYEKIKEEYSTLKSNNIILKEDINRLEQANKNLEQSLSEQQSRNYDILNQNEQLSHRILKLEELLDEANLRDEKFKINEINIEKLLNEKLFLNAKINEDEKNFKALKEEKDKYEIEYRVLSAKYIELKNKYDIMYNDYSNIKNTHDEQFNKIEDKIDNLLKEIEKLQSENNILRNENERQRIDLNSISNQRDDYKEKYNEQKNKNDLLCVKINEIENEFNDLKSEKMNEEYYKLKMEENRKYKNENKIKIVNELQNRIQKYREQRLKQEVNDDL